MTSAQDWQGRVGREWAEKADALDHLLGPVGEAGLRALGPVAGLRVMDLGCGAGASALALAARGAAVTGVDLSPDLLARARARDQAGACEFMLADAARLVHEKLFDALYSRCGAMFFDVPVDAWAHLRRQMVPGAPAIIVCWRQARENPWAMLPLETATPTLGVEATRIAPTGPGPFAWAAPAVFEAILRDAGWSDLSHEAVDELAIIEAGDAVEPAVRAAEFAMRIGPLASRLRGQSPELRVKVRAALKHAFADHVFDGHVRVGTAAWIVRARA